MGGVSERLLALRPVTSRYKEPDEDGNKPLQFGLVAEEVAEAFPELVIYDKQGKPETVRYDLIATMLLNEFRKERDATQAELAKLKGENARMAEILQKLDHEKMTASARQFVQGSSN
jgi:endosialidase-like protein